jgi:hypothetical protein
MMTGTSARPGMTITGPVCACAGAATSVAQTPIDQKSARMN